MVLGDDEKLRKMPFLDFLIEIHRRLQRIFYRKDFHDAYQESSAIGSLYRFRCVNEYNLQWNERFPNNSAQYANEAIDILDRYSYKKQQTYKAKNEAIEEFKKEFLYDLGDLIRQLGGTIPRDDY